MAGFIGKKGTTSEFNNSNTIYLGSEVSRIRDAIFKYMAQSAMIVALPALIIITIVSLKQKNYAFIAINAVFYIIVVITYFKAVPNKLKIWILGLVIFCLGAMHFHQTGLQGNGLFIIFAFTVFISLLLNLKDVIFAISIQIAHLIFVNLLYFLGYYPGEIFVNVSTLELIEYSLEFLAPSIVLALTTSFLLQKLEKTFKSEETVRRLLDIEQRRLILAKNKAESADNLKSAFLANMSHEIRTPLNGILGFADLLTEAEDEEERREYIHIIRNNGQHLLEIITDIIDISKIEVGQLEIKNQRVNVNKLFNDLYDFYRQQKRLFKNKNIQLFIETVPAANDMFIETDNTRLKQVVSNLIDNALKFTNEGYVKFGYKVKPDSVRFFVEDTGIGMSEEEQEIVFDRFTQAKTELREKVPGTGLGLSISEALVKLMGGKLFLHSKQGEGSIFYFDLPVVADYEEVEKSDLNIKSQHFNLDFSAKKILLVEDDDSSVMYIRKALEKTKVDIAHVTKGEEAVSLVKENTNKYNLILLDIQLDGEINGYEALRQIKQLDKNIPVIVQTAFAFEEDKNKCLDAGCNYYLSKPIDLHELLNTVGMFM